MVFLPFKVKMQLIQIEWRFSEAPTIPGYLKAHLRRLLAQVNPELRFV
jgi:hypothetical protein